MKPLEHIFIYSCAALSKLHAGDGAIRAASYFVAFAILMHINLLFAISGGVLHKNLALLLGKGGIVAITLLVTAAVAGHFLYNGRAARLVKSSEKIRAPNSVWIGWIIILWTFFVPFLCVLIYGSLQHR